VGISVRFLEAERLIECVYTGRIGPGELERSIQQAGELARAHQTDRCVTDLTGLVDGPSVGDLYGVPKLFEQLGFPRSLREAIVSPTISASAGDVQFYENVCINRGWTVRVFPDRAQALAWLAGSPG
jgi:hypothetical protein